LISTKSSELSEISRRLKNLAKETSIAIIALSQIDDKIELRVDKRPVLSDLTGNGLANVSDVIIFLYRDEVYNPEPDNLRKRIAELEISKNRTGPVGKLFFHFTPEYTRFECFSSEEQIFELESVQNSVSIN